MTVKAPEIVVILPSYNEEKNIEDLVKDIPQSIDQYKITPVVIDDASEDRTAEIAKRTRAIVLEHTVNQGQGAALKTGFNFAKQRNADVVVTMDSDGQHCPEDLPSLVDPVINDRVDMTVGSRKKGVDNSNNPLYRRAGIAFFTGIVNLLVNHNVTDITNGYRAISIDALSKLELREMRYSAAEILIEASKRGLEIREIPIRIAEREYGSSKKPKIRYAVGITRTIFSTYLRD